jgi:hypothetical protein
MEALERDELPLSESELERSVYCDEKYGPSYAGLGLIHAERSAAAADAEQAKAEKLKALGLLREAERLSRTDDDAFNTALTTIRLTTILGGKHWVSDVEGEYERARLIRPDERMLVYYEGREALDYYMGLSYVKAHEFEKGRDLFARVLNAKKEGRWLGPADRAWKKADRTSRALAGITVGNAGKRIVLQDFVTREDLSALLVDELGLGTPLCRPVGAPFDTVPADVAGSPFRGDILTVMKCGVRGLELKYHGTSRAYLFEPRDRVSRGEMAFVLEDLLSRAQGDEAMPIRYLGQEKSPFRDIGPTSRFYNAVVSVTSHGIMEADTSGDFEPDKPVDGATAILALRTVQQKIHAR